MKKTSILLLPCFLFLNQFLGAQQWAIVYNGTDNRVDEVKAIVADNTGNVYVTGYSTSAASSFDYVTIKYNANGIRQWISRYNGPGNGSDIPHSIFVDQTGNVYVTGASNAVPNSFFDNDAATIKYSPQGTQLWVARYGGTLNRDDQANAVKVDNNGNVYITGFTTVRNGAYSAADYLTVKYNSSGTQQWVATHNGPGNAGDAAVGLGLDAAGNIYVTGTDFAGHDPLGEGDYLTIKYDPAGVEQWQARFNGTISEADGATAIAVDDAGNSYVTGSSRLGGINTDFVTIKYNANGVQQWTADYGGEAGQGDIPSAIVVDNGGNVYVTGTDQKYPYDYDYRTLKYNSAGGLQWSKRYEGAAYGNDYGNALTVDKTGNVFVTGQSQGAQYNWDIATVMYSSSGRQVAVKRYTGTKDSDDVANAIAIDSSGNVYVAGAVTDKHSSYDFITLKYAVPGAPGNSEIVAGNPVNQSPFALQNYPNPFKGLTAVKFNIPAKEKVQLNIYDMKGKQVANLVNTELNPGSYEFKWDAANFLPGIYTCKLICGEVSETKKIILVK